MSKTIKKYYCTYCGVERDNLNAHTCRYCGKFLNSLEVIEDYHLEEYKDLDNQLKSFDDIYDKVMTKRIIKDIISPLEKKRKPSYIKIISFVFALVITAILIPLLRGIPKTINIDYSNIILLFGIILPILLIIGIIYFLNREGNK